MPDLNCLDDEGTLSFFRTLLGKRISNLPAQIMKSGNFAESQNFIDTLGVETLKVAMEAYKAKLDDEGFAIPETREGADSFLNNFLSQSSIQLWYEFGRQKQEYFDDLDAYSTNLMTRVLLDIAAGHAIREGDATFLRTYHRIMILYMLNTKDSQVLK